MHQNPRNLTTRQLQAELDSLHVEHLDLEDPDHSDLLREVQAYQLQLELQNRELRSSQLQLEVARDRYQRLYDLAPVGYLTLNRNGCILQANRQAGRTLGKEATDIIGTDFSLWIDDDCAHCFYDHLGQVFSSKTMTDTELTLRSSDGSRREIQLISEMVSAKKLGSEYCRSAFVDITRYKEIQYELGRELATTQQRLQAEISQRERLQDQLANVERKYRQILNSAAAV